MRCIRHLGLVSPGRAIPSHIALPPYIKNASHAHPQTSGLPPTLIHNASTLLPMRRSCLLARQVLDYCGQLIRPGITTDEIDALAHQKIVDQNAYPSPLGYHGFPKSICTSVNNIMCHGIPDNAVLHEGDMINIDITVYKDGFHGDCSETYFVGNPNGKDERVENLILVARQARDEAIAICGPNVPFSYISEKITTLCLRYGFSSPIELSGHGIGCDFHTQPIVFHWADWIEALTQEEKEIKIRDEEKRKREREKNEMIVKSGVMKSGMTFTIEPVVCMGKPDFYLGEDQWTVFSQDNKPSAQFEHTILITDNGHEILT